MVPTGIELAVVLHKLMMLFRSKWGTIFSDIGKLINDRVQRFGVPSDLRAL